MFSVNNCLKHIVISLLIVSMLSCKQDNLVAKKENVWVFMLAGQSNMAGRGIIEPIDSITSNRIFTMNIDEELVYGEPPLHFYEPKRSGLGLGLSFAKELLKNIPDSISILLIPTAVGGSSIDNWLEDDKFRGVQLYSNFKEKMNISRKRGIIKGVLWHQGETDVNKNVDLEDYSEKLSHLISSFRHDSRIDSLPVILGELGTYSTNKDEWNKFNLKIRKLAENDKFIKIVKANDLKDKGDKLHFNSKSIRELGKRYADAFLKF